MDHKQSLKTKPMSLGQSQPKRWFQLCFTPPCDSSDDSDTEYVGLPPSTSTSTWRETSPPEPSPPPSPPSPPLIFLPPPPPPLLPPFRRPLATAAFDIESVHRVYQPPSPNLPFEDHRHNPFVGSASFSVVEQSDSFLQAPQHGAINNANSKVIISELHDQKDEVPHCPICWEDFKVGDQACLLPCNHTYCSKCIPRWLSNHKTCPVCRRQVEYGGWEGQGGSHSIDDNGPENSSSLPLPPPPPPAANSAWDYYILPSLDSLVREVNSAGENSDDSDTEYVALPPTTSTSTWREISPPEPSPPSPELPLPPPPPPPLIFLPPPPPSLLPSPANPDLGPENSSSSPPSPPLNTAWDYMVFTLPGFTS